MLHFSVIVLIGIGSNNATYYDQVGQDCNIDRVITLDDASVNTLAKMANFISKSISSTSQSLASGNSAPISQSISF